MPPKKEERSNKSVAKKKASQIEDKTFGLKNKNKSSKVASFVQSTIKSIECSGDPKERALKEAMKRARVTKRETQKAADEERDALFGAALLAVAKKTSINLKSASGDAVGRDGNDDAKKDKAGAGRAMKMMYQMDAQEMDDRLREVRRGEGRLCGVSVAGEPLFFFFLLLRFVS